MGIFLSVVLGILGSVIASCIFLMVLREFRPNIEIGDNISKWKDIDGNTIYNLKILNKGKRKAINLKFELLLVTKKSVPKGEMSTTKSINLKKPSAFILREYEKDSTEAHYARRIGSLDNIEELWSDDQRQYIIFRVYAHDEVSGLAKLFEKEFRTRRDSIKEGEFHFGDSFEIS